MNKLLVIVGPTATGKTKLALKLAKKFDGELISADSRQVYKHMDIGTGKDIPKDGTKIWGYDLVGPKEEFSVAQYQKFAEKIIREIQKRNHLPILVGGTGLYIDSIIKGIQTSNVPKNIALRKSFENKSAEELLEILSVQDPVAAAQLNTSDKKNPRRLIRKIEIAKYKIPHQVRDDKTTNDILIIGLKLDRKLLDKKIDKRVDKRIKQGFEKEVKKLLDSGVKWEDQSMSSLGYKQWKEYVLGNLSREEAISLWKLKEKQYSKRQMTWFKKNTNINWFDVSSKTWEKEVEEQVLKWYSKANAKKD